MKTKEQIMDALRDVLVQYDDPNLGVLERNNLDAGAIVLLWVLEQNSLFHEADNMEAIPHEMVRYKITEALIEEME